MPRRSHPACSGRALAPGDGHPARARPGGRRWRRRGDPARRSARRRHALRARPAAHPHPAERAAALLTPSSPGCREGCAHARASIRARRMLGGLSTPQRLSRFRTGRPSPPGSCSASTARRSGASRSAGACSRPSTSWRAPSAGCGTTAPPEPRDRCSSSRRPGRPTAWAATSAIRTTPSSAPRTTSTRTERRATTGPPSTTTTRARCT